MGVPLVSLGAALLAVSAVGLGPPRPYAAVSRYTAQNARHSTTSGGSGRHRAPARPPVRPNAKDKNTIILTRVSCSSFPPSAPPPRPSDQPLVLYVD
jgi:hypothetical protein